MKHLDIAEINAGTKHALRIGDKVSSKTTRRNYVVAGFTTGETGSIYAKVLREGDNATRYFYPQSLVPVSEESEESDSPPEIADAWKDQIGGNHYSKLKIQPMQYSLANNLDAAQHTIIKYVTRFRDKGGIADLKKAKHSIDLLIAHEKSKGET